MGMVKATVMQQSDILRLEAEINNLWGELNTSNIPHATRMEIEGTLSGCEEEFKAVLGGQASYKALEENLHNVDMMLALSSVQQAENEVPKAEHTASVFQALENIRKELNGGTLTPVRARHEVKEIMRHQK
ncbi:MAG: hypothetical protein K0U10_06635 [Gammaproteobacteria bacterium]|nr:hypothetical protein [Gammaproteobacteria bacterium]